MTREQREKRAAAATAVIQEELGGTVFTVTLDADGFVILSGEISVLPEASQALHEALRHAIDGLVELAGGMPLQRAGTVAKA